MADDTIFGRAKRARLERVLGAYRPTPDGPWTYVENQAVADLADQIAEEINFPSIAAIADLDSRIDTLEAGAASTARYEETYAALSGVTGAAGQLGIVAETDTGTHTDPVVGGSKANAGRYRYSASPAGWKWIEPDPAAGKAPIISADLVSPQTSVPPIGDDSRKIAATATVNRALSDALYALRLDQASQPATTLLGADEGFTIELNTEHREHEVCVRDTATPAHSGVMSLETFLPHTVLNNPKIVRGKDGKRKWHQHNLWLQSQDFSQAVNAHSAGTMVAGSGEDADLWLFTPTTTAPQVSQTLNGTDAPPGRYYSQEFRVKRPSANSYAFVRVALNGVSGWAWFDLVNGVKASKDAGVADWDIFRTGTKGGLLPYGRFRLVARAQSVGVAPTPRIQFVDADLGTTGAVVAGKSILVGYGHTYNGLKPVEYIKTTTIKRAIPYHWRKGKQTLLSNGAGACNTKTLFGSDLTNAAWIADGLTAAFDAVDELGEPCSTLTVATAGGTITQIVAGGANNTGQCEIVRTVGTGLWELIVDGTTWVPIMFDAAGVWVNPIAHKGSGQVTLGIRGNVVGNKVQVARLHSQEVGYRTTPIPTFAATVTRPGDLGTITISSVATVGDDLVMYVDAELDDDATMLSTSAFGAAMSFNATGVNLNCTATSTIINGGCVVTGNNATYPLNARIGDAPLGGRLEMGMRVDLATDEVWFSANGLGTMRLLSSVPLTMTTFSFAGGIGQMMVNRVKGMTRKITDHELQYSVGYSGTLHDPGILDYVNVRRWWPTDVPDDARRPGGMREVQVALCEQTPLNAWGIYDHGERNRNLDVAGAGEAPSRTVAGYWYWDEISKKLTVAPPTFFIEPNAEPADWDAGSGHIQDVSFFRERRGSPREGRTWCLYSQEDSANGLYIPTNQDQRRMYATWSDNLTDPLAGPWSTPVMFKGFATAANGSAALGSPCGPVQLPGNHPIKPWRILLQYYSISGGGPETGVMYLDPGDTTVNTLHPTDPSLDVMNWQQGGIVSGGTGTNEGTLHVMPNGWIGMTVRYDIGPPVEVNAQRKISVSKDAGALWSPLAASGTLGFYDWESVSMAVVQTDLDGSGPYGAPLIIGPRVFQNLVNQRRCFTVERLMGADLHPSGAPWRPFGNFAIHGYPGAVWLKTGTLIVFTERPPTGTGNGGNSFDLMALRPPPPVLAGRPLPA